MNTKLYQFLIEAKKQQMQMQKNNNLQEKALMIMNTLIINDILRYLEIIL